MARDWEKLAGEQGKEVPAGRFGRLVRMGSLGVSVGASTVFNKMGKALRFGKEEPERDARFLTHQAEKVAGVLGQMKGAAMKLGQVLSTDPDLLPAEVVDVLTGLQSEAPPMTFSMVRKQIEDAFDQPIDSIFDFFDPEPLGAASIGQVHRARLLTGEEVAVKIQYPGIRETLDSDMKNLGTLMSLSRVMIERKRLDQYLEEVKGAILDESDYEQEARNIARFREILSERPGIRVPKPYPEWTRQEVLTMEFIPGQKLDDALLAMPEGPERQSLLARFVGSYSWMLHVRYELHCDPHPGNFLVDEAGNLVFLDFGCVAPIDPKFADGLLDLLDACWHGDDDRAAGIYLRLGFGGSRADESLFDPDVLRTYHDICLAPLIRDEEFDFSSWEMHSRLNRFIFENPVFLRWVPPAEGLMVFRVMSGIKGLFTKVGARLNVREMAVDLARDCGRLSAEP